MVGKVVCFQNIFHKYVPVAPQKFIELFQLAQPVWSTSSEVLCATDSKLNADITINKILTGISLCEKNENKS